MADEKVVVTVSPIKICYVCGRRGQGYASIAKNLAKCSSKLCTLKSILGVDTVFIDKNFVPPEGLTEAFRLSVTKKNIPFEARDPKQKCVAHPLKFPTDVISKYIKPAVKPGVVSDKPVYVSKFDILVKMMKERPKTITEMAAAVESTPQSINAQFSLMRKKGFTVIQVIENGFICYKIEDKNDKI